MKSPTKYLKEALAIYTKKENFIFFARVMAVLVIISSIISYLISYFYSADYVRNGDFSNIPMLVGFIVLTLLSIIIGLWSQTTTYYSIFKIGSDEKEIFRLGYKNMLRYLAVSFVVGVIIFFGLILLIIPAFIFGTWYAFSILLVLDKDMKVKESLKVSKLMVKDRFWAVTGRSLAIGLVCGVVSLVLSAIPYVGPLMVAFIAPLFMLPFYLLYKDLLDITN
jgi:hypothetical protein